jgi:hypothetical protein
VILDFAFDELAHCYDVVCARTGVPLWGFAYADDEEGVLRYPIRDEAGNCPVNADGDWYQYKELRRPIRFVIKPPDEVEEIRVRLRLKLDRLEKAVGVLEHAVREAGIEPEQ